MRKIIPYIPICCLFYLLLSGGLVDRGAEVLQMWGWNGTNNVPMMVDKATRSIPEMDYEHHEIHVGDAFYFTDIATVNNGNVREYIMVTPNTTKWCHLVWEISGTLITTVEIFEGTTTSDNGTEITIYNRNRNNGTSSTMNAYHTPTITLDGTKLYAEKFGVSGGNSIRIGGVVRSAQEVILKQNTKYLFRVTSGSASNDISSKFRWYSHINEN
jgi:hypothetical protein